MDFFSAAPVAARVSAEPSTGSFADAIASRYALTPGGPRALRSPVELKPAPPPGANAAVVPPTHMAFPALGSMTLSSPPRGAVPASGGAGAGFSALAPSELARLLADPAVLVLDLRPHTLYALSRIKSALGLAAPSTLLRRPAFGLDMLAGMVAPAPGARARFADWRAATTIVVYDADASAAPEASTIHGLLNKFAAQGVESTKLCWVRGGFQAVHAGAGNVVDTARLSEDEAPGASGPSDTPAPTAVTTAPPNGRGLLHGRGLPMQAFSLASTTSKAAKPTSLPPSAMGTHSAGGTPGSARASNPFFDNIRQNIELGRNATPTSSRIPLVLPPAVREHADHLPLASLRTLAHEALSDGDRLADELAQQFTDIERAEQKRLMGVMAHHAKEVGTPDAGFAFGITAGFEKGQKNRYRNIWPFEHSRVRLVRPPDVTPAAEFDDYVNASHVQPACTRRRYIATQGPLPDTFADFWALVWAHNVRVLVMLTREREGAQTKCARYWVPGAHGELSLVRVGPGSPTAAGGDAPTGGFFVSEDTTGRTVRREFELRHAAYPHAPPRRITQLQYTGWDDMHVPADAREVLDVVRAVRDLQASLESEGDEGDEGVDPRTGVVRGVGGPPVLVHCSAGIGRTGGFIALDSALDAVLREVRTQRAAAPPPRPTAAPRGFDDVGMRRPAPTRLVSDVGIAGRGVMERGAERGAERAPERRIERAPDPFRMHAGLASGAAGGRSPLATPASERPPTLPTPAPIVAPEASAKEECYRAPRALHGRGPPGSLTSVQALVADMREQRMSLVQTLRQYVFVHLAVLQGALEIAEEAGAA